MALVSLNSFVGSLKSAAKGFQKSRGDLYAAAVAYYILIAAVPFLILVISIFGAVMGSSQEAADRVISLVRDTLPTATDEISKLIKRVIEVRSVTKGIGLLGLVYSASQIFSVLEDAMTHSWDTKTRTWIRRIFLTVGLSVVVGFLPLLSVLMTISADLFNRFGMFLFEVDFAKMKIIVFSISYGVPIALMWLFFTSIYKILPKCHVRTSAAMKGALLTTALFEIAKHIFSIYFTRFAHLDKIYGSIAGIFALILWAQYASLVMLYGAELVRVLHDAPKKVSDTIIDPT